MGDGFKLRDDDNDDVTITENKYIKFTAATGTAGTNVTGSGSTGDPYVMAITLPNDTIANTFRTVTVDTNGDGTANDTLGGTETLMLKKGNDITLEESSGVVTITNSSPHVATNLGKTTATGQITITSSTGDDVVIGEATDAIAGLMSTTHHDKLENIEASADVTDTANVKTALNADMGGNFTIGNQTDDIATFTGHVSVGGNLTVTGTVTTNNVETISTSNGVLFEGSIANTNETRLVGGDPSGSNNDITITLPNTQGSLALVDTAKPVNHVYAGPSSGSSAVVPTFRALVSGDIPNLNMGKITSGTLAIDRGGTGSTTAPMIGVITAADQAAARTALGLGALSTLDEVASATITNDSITEVDLKVTNTTSASEDNYLLSYDHATTGFTWVAPTASGIGLTDLDAATSSASGSGGSLAYDDNGTFTFTPALNIAGNSATSTVTANDSTNENNYLTFAANATASGSLGLETDTALYFNPSQDTLYVPYVSATNLTASNLISAVNGIIVTGNNKGINLTGTGNFVKTDNLYNDTSLSISTTGSNGNITLSPHGNGNVTLGTDGTSTGAVRLSSPIYKTGTQFDLTETAHTSTASNLANSGLSYAQKRGITKIQGRISPLSNPLTNGSNVSITVLPNGAVHGSNCSYRGIKGTIHIDAGISGSGNFVLTQDFIANDRDGGGTWAFVSSNAVFEGRTDFPFKISWAEITSDDMQLKIENNTGADVGTGLTIWWDLTMFPQI